jgi:6-phosphofructokinase 1
MLDLLTYFGPVGDRNQGQKMVTLRQPMNCWIESFSETFVMRNIRYAVLTSGGDAPGMNAALRAVVRTGLYYGVETLGVRCGYKGLLDTNFAPLSARDVGGIIQLGGSILGSGRCDEFETPEGIQEAISVLKAQNVDGLIVIGGSGSQAGAAALAAQGFRVVGIPSTIDNDLCGTDISIGVDTALNVALEAIDRIKVTASSHHRAFLVEVMGRDCGYLALMAGIAGGAEAIIIPEAELDPETLADTLREAYQRGKAHAIAVIAEGAVFNAFKLESYFKNHQERLGFELRVITLGHIQRGGCPTAFDRLIGTRFGAAAVECLHRETHGVLVGMQKNAITSTPLLIGVGRRRGPDQSLFRLAEMLAI